MFEVDGQQKSGSGTILRLAVAFSSILSEELHIYNIRRNRPNPGLRPQHLESVLTAAKLCDADVEGAILDSTELWYSPGRIQAGTTHASIGTAGSIPMLLLTILPICIHARGEITVVVSEGGTDTRYSPTINYLGRVLLPTLSKMGVHGTLEIRRYGYYPKGNGEVSMTVKSDPQLRSLNLEDFGVITEVDGISVATFLEDRKVAERQADSAKKYLSERGIDCRIEVVNDRSNRIQKGSSILLRAKTNRGVILGGDSIGEIRKPSERVGLEAAKALWQEIEARATTDIHLSDMLIPYISFCDERSLFLCREITEHLETNIWLSEEMVGTTFRVERRGELFQVECAPKG